MELRVLQYFLAVAREQNISAAAQSLHLTQPTLSRQLRDLEEELGKQLMIRGNRKITLTEDGRLLRKRAEEILDLVGRTEKEIAVKLGEYEYPEDIIRRVMEFLKKYEYVNDEEYCRKYIKETMKLRPKGKFLIKMELKERGIKEEVIDEALEEAEIDEQPLAEALLERKYEDFANMDRKELSRVYGFLQRKGFSYGVIKAAVASLAEKGI